MAEIYQLPENGNSNGNGGIPFSIPLGNGNGLFGNNGMNSIADLFGLAIIASIFGWNNGGFGWGNGGMNGGAGFLSNQISNDSGRELVMNAITSQGEASRTAVANLANALGQDFNLVNAAVANVQNTLSTIASNQGMSTMQVINAIQSGNASLAGQFASSCCEMKSQLAANAAADQLAICNQTNVLQSGATANTQTILNKLAEIQTQSLQDKLDAARNENTRLAGEISQANQNNVIAGMIANAVNPLVSSLNSIRSEVDAIKRCQPSTITLPNNSMTAVPSIWANAVADNIVDRIAAALTPTTTTTTTTP